MRETAGNIEFVVAGRPVPAVRMTNRGKWVNPSAIRYLAYKDAVGWAAKAASWDLIKGPVRVEIHLYLRGGQVGDVDNYAKSILDGCNGVIWVDDTQVVDLRVCRHKGSPERAEVKVVELSEQEVAAVGC